MMSTGELVVVMLADDNGITHSFTLFRMKREGAYVAKTVLNHVIFNEGGYMCVCVGYVCTL